MKSTIKVGTEVGCLFEAEHPGSFAFVPLPCLVFTPDGKIDIDELQYSQSGWDVKNMRFNTEESVGSRLYPEPEGLVTEFKDDAAADFVDRLQTAYSAVYH